MKNLLNWVLEDPKNFDDTILFTIRCTFIMILCIIYNLRADEIRTIKRLLFIISILLTYMININ